MTNWELCKQSVNKLSSKYEYMMGKHPSKVKRFIKPKGIVIEIHLGKIYDYEVEMETRIHNEKGVISSKYYAWNNDQNVAYIRDVINESFQQKQEVNNI